MIKISTKDRLYQREASERSNKLRNDHQEQIRLADKKLKNELSLLSKKCPHKYITDDDRFDQQYYYKCKYCDDIKFSKFWLEKEIND